MAAVVEDVVVGVEDPVGEPVLPQELPDVLDRVQLRCFWRQGQEGDVVGDVELRRRVPPGLVEEDDGVGARGDGGRDLAEMQLHGGGVAERQDEARALALFGADGAEDIG